MPLEADVQRKLTRAFVAANPSSIVLSRKTKVPNGAGGFTYSAPTTLPPQTLRFVYQGGTTRTRTIDGDTETVPAVLVGEVGVDIQVDDEFVLGNDRFRVRSVDDANAVYKTQAEVTRVGPAS